jgi:hypothetical protein
MNYSFEVWSSMKQATRKVGIQVTGIKEWNYDDEY